VEREGEKRRPAPCNVKGPKWSEVGKTHELSLGTRPLTQMSRPVKEGEKLTARKGELSSWPFSSLS